MIILSCDLSLTGSAFALLEFQGGHLLFVKTWFVNNSKNAKHGNGFRLEQIAQQLEDIIEAYQIDYVVIEKGFSRFNNATQALFRVVGVVEYVLSKNGLWLVHFIAPTSVKKTITGDGKATKDQVMEALKQWTPTEFNTLDESDAVAVGVSFALEKKILKSVTTKDTKVEKNLKEKSTKPKSRKGQTK